ncbi:uncharacterized protein C3orf14 homolog [Brienomyrus brachyistius]|uniref:uncharacterized protein C3orf14 homolog n=1 Tax=Brienomyrus brachyistius TaxID=42636 RepID=UPI0020B456DC|nr:uncharacterized protein C3orf14 homolog [Brienomyrus brachyistius]
MAARLSEEIKLTKKHEEILAKRTDLLGQMESGCKQHREKREQHAILWQSARERNTRLLQDLQKMEERLSARPRLQPEIINLQTCYWESIEEKIPEWEDFLLGRGPPPSAHRGWSSRSLKRKGAPQDRSKVKVTGLPPRASTKCAS